jgi:fluoroquinolone resistance protein
VCLYKLVWNLLHCELLGLHLDDCDNFLLAFNFKNCDLKRAVFENTNLESADLRTSFNFTIDPENNCIGKAKFSTQNTAGLLDRYNIIIE